MSTDQRRETLSISYPAMPASVPSARGSLVEYARQAGADDAQIESLRLAVSEAFTNAVRHAYPDGCAGFVHVTAAMADGELWVLVADDGQGFRAGSHSPGLGVGLALIASVSDFFSVVKRSTGGTELRMRFAAMSQNSSGAAVWGQARDRGSVSSARSAA